MMIIYKKMKKRFNEGDVVYFISSSVLLRKLLLFVMLVDFVQYGLQMAIVVLLEHVFVKVNCIVQRKRQRKLLNNIKMQTSGDDGFSTFMALQNWMRCQEINFQITWGIEWISTPQTTWAMGSTYGDRNVILCTSFLISEWEIVVFEPLSFLYV